MKKLIFIFVLIMFFPFSNSQECNDPDGTNILNYENNIWDNSYGIRTSILESNQESNKIIPPDQCIGYSDILAEWHCVDQSSGQINIDCSNFGKSCFNGECLEVINTQQMQNVCRLRGCNFKFTDIEGDTCGNMCPEDRCEDEYFQGDYATGFTGVYRWIDYPEYSGVFHNGNCLRSGCSPSYFESNYCSNFMKDSDSDGVPDTLDECEGNIYSNLINEFSTNSKVNKYGCPETFVREFSCVPISNQDANNENANLNIIFYPCGLGKTAEEASIFEYWSKLTAAGFSPIEPFKSNPSNYQFYYIWDTEKKDIITNAEIDQLDACLWGLEATKEKIINSPNCPENNVIIYQIAYRAYQGDVMGKVFELGSPFGVQRLGLASCCPENKHCCESFNDYFVSTALHEVGHSLKLSHIFSNQEDAEFSSMIELKNLNGQDYEQMMHNLYSPTVYPISDSNKLEENCPVWDYETYKKWENSLNSEVKCYPGQYDTINLFGPVNENTIMLPHNYVASDYYFDPVSAKLIEDALTLGYDRYLELSYPKRCEQILESTYFKEILLKKPENKGKKIEDLAAECLIKACRHVEESRKEECCGPILDMKLGNEYHQACLED